MKPNLWTLKSKTILLAEDDSITRKNMGEMLEMIFHKVYLARDGEEALAIFEEFKPDIVVTDIKMPKKDGLSLVKNIRLVDYEVPIIMLTSFSEQDLLLNAANLSIDAYLIKPVGLETLIKSISGSVKRLKDSLGIVEISKETYYNADTKECYKNGSRVTLGIKELQLLELLIKNHTKTITKEEIINELWLFEPTSDSALKNLILRLRKKVGDDFVLSVRGIGYRLNIEQV